jgi:hypothetical protein
MVAGWRLRTNCRERVFPVLSCSLGCSSSNRVGGPPMSTGLKLISRRRCGEDKGPIRTVPKSGVLPSRSRAAWKAVWGPHSRFYFVNQLTAIPYQPSYERNTYRFLSIAAVDLLINPRELWFEPGMRINPRRTRRAKNSPLTNRLRTRANRLSHLPKRKSKLNQMTQRMTVHQKRVRE